MLSRFRDAFKDQVIPLIFDVTDGTAVKAASSRVRKMLAGEPLLGLVNNAGAGTAGPLLFLPLEELRQQREVNLVAPLGVIQHFAPLLESSTNVSPGRIVNIGSTAGSIGIPFMGAYAASKHGLKGLSESLRRELLIYGIDVITVVPGPVKTPIWDKAEALDFSRYSATPYSRLVEEFRKFMVGEGRNGLEPKQIGAAVLTALTKKHPRPEYLVTSHKLKNWTLPRRLPARWTDKLLAKQFGLKRLLHASDIQSDDIVSKYS